MHLGELFKKLGLGKRHLFFALLSIFVAIFAVSIWIYQLSNSATKKAQATSSWYNVNWHYSKPVTINNTGNASALTNYQVKVNVTYNTHMQADFDDIRFTNSDGTTLLNYWLESKTDSTSAIYWVKVPSIAASSSKTIYMYYGNSGASSASNGDNTFEYFDDFEEEINASYCGVWYASPVSGVYGGPAATYSNWNRPMGVYAPTQNKTFFVYANANNAPVIGYYDHVAETFSEPVVIGANIDMDAHRNPSVLIDEDGYIYVFWGSHGNPTHVSKSTSPYNISSWVTKVDLSTLTSYPQPWQLEEDKLFVSFREGTGKWRYATSDNGADSWSASTDIIDFSAAGASGIYLVSVAETGSYPRRVHLAWSYYVGTWDQRWDVYYAYSDDGGTSWKKRDGTTYALPITGATADKVYESGDEGVWLNDIQLDSSGNPHLVFISANRTTFQGMWKTARYSAGNWIITDLTASDHMYDLGSMVFINDNDIRIYIPSTPSQTGEDGGEIEEWTSTDGGQGWANTKHITSDSTYSHQSVKTVWNHQQSDFRVFWSYGDAIDSADNKSVNLYYYGESKSNAGTIYDCRRGSVTWTKYEAGGSVSISGEQKKTGSYSEKMLDSSPTLVVRLSTQSLSETKNIVGSWARVNAVGYLSLYAYDGSTYHSVVGFSSDGHFRYWDGSNHSTVESYSINTWYLITIEFDVSTGKYNFVVYDTDMNEFSRVDDISFGNGVPSVLDTFMFYTSAAGQISGYVDGFRNRQFVSPEPSTSLGTEIVLTSPSVTVQPANNITTSSATLHGTITDAGTPNATTRGFKYYQSSNCTGAENDKSESGSFGAGAYSLSLASLASNTSYSYKSYATNFAGTVISGVCEAFSTLDIVSLNTDTNATTGTFSRVWRTSNEPFASFSVILSHAFDLPFIFDASESFGARGIVKYYWDLGDGTTSEEMRVSHQYLNPGRYTVTLTITDKAGKTATKQQTVDANPPKPTVEDISADGNDLVFKGKSYPKTTVHLEIRSNPLLVQANSSESGEWSYKVVNAKETVGEGDHTVSANASYVLADKTELTSESSKTYDFYVSLDNGKLKVEMEKSKTKIWQYVSAGLVLIIVTGAVVFLLKRARRRKQNLS